jgi:hypothetical protein
MRDAVIEKFHAYKQNSEGKTSHMYCDVNGNVTIGVGCAFFSKTHMLSGYKATKAHWSVKSQPSVAVTATMVEDDYQACKDLYATGVKKVSKYAEVTKLRLAPAAGTRALTNWKIGRFEANIRTYCPEWHDYPADAQFACIGMVWGPGVWATLRKTYPALTTAIEAADFATAATLITFPVKSSSKKRKWLNKGFEFMLANAAVVVAAPMSPDTLYWPSKWEYDAESEIALETDWMSEDL